MKTSNPNFGQFSSSQLTRWGSYKSPEGFSQFFLKKEKSSTWSVRLAWNFWKTAKSLASRLSQRLAMVQGMFKASRPSQGVRLAWNFWKTAKSLASRLSQRLAMVQGMFKASRPSLGVRLAWNFWKTAKSLASRLSQRLAMIGDMFKASRPSQGVSHWLQG
jgi:hypothetical protein